MTASSLSAVLARYYNSGLTNTSVSALAVSGSKLFAATYGGTSGGVYVSVNNGTSWTKASSGLPATGNVTSLAASGNNIIAGTGVSSDSGTGVSKGRPVARSAATPKH